MNLDLQANEAAWMAAKMFVEYKVQTQEALQAEPNAADWDGGLRLNDLLEHTGAR